jgi:hypothetical protein
MRRTTRAPCTQRRAEAQAVAHRRQQGTSGDTRGSSLSLSSSVVSPLDSPAAGARADASPGGQDQRAGASGEGERLGVAAASTLTSARRCSDHPAWRGLAAPHLREATRGDASRARDAAGGDAGGEAGRLQACAAETHSAMGPKQTAATEKGRGDAAAGGAAAPPRASLGAEALGGRPRKGR